LPENYIKAGKIKKKKKKQQGALPLLLLSPVSTAHPGQRSTVCPPCLIGNIPLLWLIAFQKLVSGGMADPMSEAGKYKLSLEHLIIPESKEVLKGTH
jgi:hypothetical protein